MKKSKVGYLIIASAIIWGAVMIGTALILKGSPYKEEVTRIILYGVIFHFLFIWAPLGTFFKNKKQDKGTDKADE